MRSQGFSDYSVYPAGERAQYTSIVYVEIIAEYLDGHAFDLTLIEDGELHPNGRGIAVARHVSFRTLQINEAGNEVVVTLTTIP